MQAPSHHAFLPCKQVCGPRGRDPSVCPLPPHSQAQPTHGSSPGVLPMGAQHHVQRGDSVCGRTQPVREPVLQNWSGTSQGTGGPGKLPVTSSPCACPAAPGMGRLQHPLDGCLQAWAGARQGWGDLLHNHHPWESRSTQPSGPDFPPTMHRVSQADLGSTECAPRTLLSTLHGLSPARQHPLYPPTQPKGHGGDSGKSQEQGVEQGPILPRPGCSASWCLV